MKMIDKFREEHPTWELNVEAECPREFGYVEHEDEECPCVSCEECWGREIKVKVTNDMLIRLSDRLETENCIIAPSEDGMSIWVKLDDEWSVRGGTATEVVRIHDILFPKEKNWEEEISKIIGGEGQ